MKDRIIIFVLVITICLFSLTAYSAFDVKVIYFQPTDSQDRSEWLDLASIMRSIQDTYKSEMERHGFRDKIFRLETGQDGSTVVVHKVKGRHNKAHYAGETLTIVVAELRNKGYDDPQSIYCVVMAGMNALWHNFAGGVAYARPIGGWDGSAEYYGYCASVETTRGQVEDVIRHELGHTFGLQHITLYDPGDYIMGSGDKLSFHEARWLSRHHYFNRVWIHNLAPKIIEFHDAEVFDNDKIRFRATSTDHDGLFQVYGFVNTNIIGWNFYGDGARRAAIDFKDISREYLQGDKIYFQLMDNHGNWAYYNPETYTLPEIPNKNEPVAENRQSPDCVLCDLDGFKDHLDDELNDILNIPKENIALTFEYASENSLTPINSPREWDGWVIGVWEKTPAGITPHKSQWYFDFPEMDDLSHWIYSHAPSRIQYNILGGEFKSFGAYFILPAQCTQGMNFTAYADDIEIYSKNLYLPDYGTYIEFEIPEDTKYLTLNIGDMGSKDCDHYVLGEPKLFKNPHTEINADVNKDGYVDLYDVLIVKSGINNSVKYDTDINNDGLTNNIDLMIVKAKALQAIASAAPRKRKIKLTTWGSMKTR